MTRDEILAVFKEAGVLLEGHFLLTSGRHSKNYLQCAKLFQNTKYAEPLCRLLAEQFKDQNITVVIGPAMGAVLMAYEVSRHLGVPNFFTERDENGGFVLRRGFSVGPEDRVLIVEDVITTGGSVLEVYDLVKKTGATICGVGSIVNRSGGKAIFEVPFQSVISFDIETYAPEDCPLCKELGTAPYKPGSRKI